MSKKELVNQDARIVHVAKDFHGRDGKEITVLSTGVLARVIPVSPSLLDECQSSVPLPKVPTFFNEDKGREEENPNHPDYLFELKRAEDSKNSAAMDGLIMFGVLLVDENGEEIGAPDDDAWLGKIRFMHRRGRLNLDGIDLDDPLDREFIYKKYIAVAAPDIMMISKRSGLSEEDVEKALESFQDK